MSKQNSKDMICPEMECFMNESLSNVVFVVEGKRVPAFKEFLMVKNRVFRAQFSGGFKDANEKEIIVEDTTFEAFKTLIRFLYTDEFDLNSKDDIKLIHEIYKLSDKYESYKLMDKICDHLKSIITSENIISISRIAFDNKNKDLMRKGIEFIEKNIKQLILRDITELRELNEITDNLVLDAMMAQHFKARYAYEKRRGQLDSSFESILIEDMKTRFSIPVLCLKWSTDDVLKAFVGFVYFKRLVLRDGNVFQLIGRVCNLAKHFGQTLLLDSICEHLMERICFENLSLISKIGFYYKIEKLITKVKEFIAQNLKDIIKDNTFRKVKNEINNSLGSLLMEAMGDFVLNSDNN